MRVLVTDGDNRAALAATRSLGRAGHEVHVSEKRLPSLAQQSRFCYRGAVYPDPAVRSDDFVDALVELVRARRIEVLLPMADITTLLLARHRARFLPLCAFPFAPVEVLERAANKVDIVQTAQQIGVPVPRSVVVSTADEIRVPDFGFPLVVKPRQSRVQTAIGWQSSSVSFARSPQELAADLKGRPPHEFPVLLQELIDGPGLGVFACYHERKAIALFSHRRLRERPPWGGVSVLCESVSMCPVAREHATRLLDEIGWEGVAMVEFKRDKRDGVPRLMEINGRFWGSLQLAIDAGVDFPSLLLATVSGPIPEDRGYRVGVQNRWLWGDVDSLLLTLRGRPRAPVPGVARLRAIREFLRFGGRALFYENPKRDDMRPWFFESAQWFRSALLELRHK